MMLKHGALVMAIDGTRMLLFRNQGDTRKVVLQTIREETVENPRTSEQGSDRPGRSFSSASPRRSAMSETDWHEEAKRQFAQHALMLLETHQKEDDGDVIVMAAPSMLGDLRKQCPAKLKSSIIAEIDKDVVNHPPEEIAAILEAQEA